MAKKKNDITIDKSSIEDFIWMSYRYCIGRKTIASAMHSNTIKTLINNNPNVLSEERIKFMVDDIRKEINHVLHAYSDNVVIEGFNSSDVFSLLFYSLNDNYDLLTKFTVDTYQNKVFTEKLKKEIDYYKSFRTLYDDLLPWVRLANSLDKECYKKITVEYNNQIEEHTVYSYPRINNGKYEEVYADIDTNDVCIIRYISPEYIIKIENIN